MSDASENHLSLTGDKWEPRHFAMDCLDRISEFSKDWLPEGMNFEVFMALSHLFATEIAESENPKNTDSVIAAKQWVLEGRLKNEALASVLCAAYCTVLNWAEDRGDTPTAWRCVGNATQWVGIMIGYCLSNRAHKMRRSAVARKAGLKSRESDRISREKVEAYWNEHKEEFKGNKSRAAKHIAGTVVHMSQATVREWLKNK